VIGTTTLVSSLTANAAQTAPVGLHLSIASTAAAGLAAQTAAFETTKTLAMTTLQKAAVAGSLAVAVGIGLYQQQAMTQNQERLLVQEQQSEHLREESRQVRRERDNAISRLAGIEQEIEAARIRIANEEHAVPVRDSSVESEMDAILNRVKALKQRVAQTADKRTRNIEMLTAKDWINVVLDQKLETEADIDRALGNLEGRVQVKWGDMIKDALQKYADAHDGQLPSRHFAIGCLPAPHSGSEFSSAL